jgi:hypothetical protein
MFDVNVIIRIQVTGSPERRRKQLLDDVKTNRRYWNVEEKGLGRTLWITRFGLV